MIITHQMMYTQHVKRTSSLAEKLNSYIRHFLFAFVKFLSNKETNSNNNLKKTSNYVE